MNLQRKILLLLVPLVMAPLVGVGYVAYVQLRDSEQQNRFGEMTLVMDQVGARFDAHLRTAEANISLFASNFVV